MQSIQASANYINIFSIFEARIIFNQGYCRAKAGDTVLVESNFNYTKIQAWTNITIQIVYE